MSGPLAGDELTDALVPVASALISAVHALDTDEVSALFAEAAHLAGDQLAAARALVVLLAGMCIEDQPVADVLAWTRNPQRYGDLRDDGVPALLASLRSGRGNSPQGDAA
jgi:hypothetical protein